MEKTNISEIRSGDQALSDTPESEASELEKRIEVDTSDLEKRMEVEASELEKRIEADNSELEKRNEDPERNSDGEESLPEEPSEKVEETKIPLMKDDSVSIKVEGEDTPTLPINKKNEDVDPKKSKLPKYLFPIRRMKLAWTRSSNVCDFVMKATVIVFSTLGWLFCVGGVPFISLAMLIIGSIYLDNCNAQPNIPVYLIVSGVFGTVQHVIAIWTKYVPKDSQGRLQVYRAYCKVIDGVITLFLTIWFVLGCIWVYGVKDVDFQDTYKDEYCHKTLYYFAFWILNLSFIILAVVVVLSLCCILCVVASPKNDEKGSAHFEKTFGATSD